MRIPPIRPENLSKDQKQLYEDMRAGITSYFKGISGIDSDGAVLGPFNPWLHEPRIGRPIWDLTMALAAAPVLPRPVREVAILVVGARFRAAYEIFAHVIIGERVGLPDDKIAPSLPASGRRTSARRNRSPTTPQLLWWGAARCPISAFAGRSRLSANMAPRS